MSDSEHLERLEAMIREQGRAQASLIDTVDRLLPLLARGPSHSSTSNAARATVTQNDRTPMWVCLIVVVILATALVTRESGRNEQAVALQAGITRLQGETAELRAEVRDLRATDNAVRAYINTGILKPKTEAKK